MAYSELIKNFDRIRQYMRGFYIYGFKSREEYGQRSARSYDNERRRIESYLGDSMGFRRTAAGKQVFLSIDSREQARNPLYKALKAKSFTDILLDALSDGNWHSLKELMDDMDGHYLAPFSSATVLDESTVRNKLKEYAGIGLVESRREGRATFFRQIRIDCPEDWADAAAFFSEAGPLGAIGSFILDALPPQSERFSFKHHYITEALDSETMHVLLDAISQRRRVHFENRSRDGRRVAHEAVPLAIFHGTQNGRQHLMAYLPAERDFHSFRLDYLYGAALGGGEPAFDELRTELDRLRRHCWGVMLSCRQRAERVAFTVYFGREEGYILRRMEREKRCGRVTLVDGNHCRFEAELYDTGEILPWIRTFIGRITELEVENRRCREILMSDLRQMAALYGLEEGK